MEANHETLRSVLEVAFLWFIAIVSHNYNDIVHGVLGTISVAYLVWKFRRDVKRSKKLKDL